MNERATRAIGAWARAARAKPACCNERRPSTPGLVLAHHGVMPTDHTRGPIERYMTADHERLDELLHVAVTPRDDGSVDAERYAEFRHDLLQHIAREEKVLFPFAREKRAGVALPVAHQLHLDHGEIAKLLVRSPNADIAAQLRELLARHNPLEEGPGGLYAECDRLAQDDAPRVVGRLQAQARVPVASYYDGPLHKVR